MHQRVRNYARNLFAAACLAAASPAAAHPHVWTEMATDLVFTDQGMVKGLAILWTFDDAYAREALSTFTPDANGNYRQAELDALTRENVDALKDYEYFTLMRVDGEKQALGEVDPKLAKNVWRDGKLSLLLFVPLRQPVDPRQGSFSVKVFDPEYYVAIDYRKDDPFRVTGKPPQGCKVALEPLASTADLVQTRAFLADKDKDWKPPPDQEFGETFAQALTVACG
jgi:ABC-type uncharacterized transport system substrate-binding protein